MSPVIQLTPEQVTLVASLLQGDNIIVFDATKRKTLEQIFAAAGIVLAAPLVVANPEPWERKPMDVNEETLLHLEELTRTCWELSNGTELHIAEGVLPQFLPRLVEIAPYQPRAAGFVAQCLQLKSILVAHKLNLSDKIALCEQSVDYAKQAKDHNVLVAALIQLAVAYQYAKQPTDALRSYQEALLYAQQISPLLQSRVYVEAAEAFALHNRRREAEFYLSMGYEVFPDQPEQDLAFVYADSGRFTLALYDGLMHLDNNQPEQAWKVFETFKKSPFARTTPERIRLEIVNHQGRAAILSKNLEQYVLCLDDGLSGAIALDSRKRYDEAVTIFQQDMPKDWRHELKIREIAEKYHLILPS